jgi:predicted MFS family arabinose efflux permease
MIQNHGWRSGFLMLSGIALLGLPLTALLVRNRPEAAIVRAEHHADIGMTVPNALRTGAFWILAFITILSAFSENGLVTNLASILTQHGVLAATAALALSVRGGAGIIARLGVGYAIDRVSPERIQSFVLAMTAAGVLILAFAGSGWAALLGAAVLGMGLGSEADVGPYLLAKYFGRRHFSVLYGLTWTAYAIGGATGPLWIGHLYDRAGVYLPRFIVYLAAVAFGAVILSLFLRSERASVAREPLLEIQRP